tara:strand:+ start:527 stop:1150 length:624 start_codon:yes stop_codon:yes gene_type:complete
MCTNTLAQGLTSHWNFGYNAALLFGNYNPTALHDSEMQTVAGCASISSNNGELLYYASPTHIWDKNHGLVTNSENIIGYGNSSQGALFIPHPIDPNKHFLVTNDYAYPLNYYDSTNRGHFIHRLDRTMTNPNGKIASNYKNKLFSAKTGERLTAVHHSNGRDVWLVLRKPYSDTIMSFLLTEDGVQTPPIYSITPADTSDPYGQIKA